MSHPVPPIPPRASRAQTLGLFLGTLLLAVLPWLSVLYDPAALVHSVRGLVSSTIASLLAVSFAAWVLVLLRRERETARRHLLELEALVVTDALTGLGNRRALERDLARAMLRARRLPQPLALLFLDVDDLKSVNDHFGHAAGDETLRALGHVVRTTSREGVDSGYRIGGDEFVVVVLGDRTGAGILAERLRRGFENHSPHQSGLSLGVVEWDGAMSAGELLGEADRRMYLARAVPGGRTRRIG